jgi:hypothetical protein
LLLKYSILAKGYTSKLIPPVATETSTKGTLDIDILYGKIEEPWLCGYSKSDWSRFVDDRKSTTSFVFNLGTRAISWVSKKQHAISLSSTKA